MAFAKTRRTSGVCLVDEHVCASLMKIDTHYKWCVSSFIHTHTYSHIHVDRHRLPNAKRARHTRDASSTLIHTYTHTHIHTYTYTHVHTYTHRFPNTEEGRFYGSFHLLGLLRMRQVSSHKCVAVCCSVLQCVAVCCSVLQCVAV